MTDNLSDAAAFDASAIGTAAVTALGDSALGHAVRRARALADPLTDAYAADAIAAHDSHV
jgi:hypothetical protein